jgi:hypothetical protein
MKKVLAVLAVVLMLAGVAFAGVTSVTKENSQSGYPGELTLGSVNGTNTFISDLPLLSNIALLEYIGGIYGLVVLKSDMGTMGISISPNVDPRVTGVSGNNFGTVGLEYATEMGAMPVGAALLYGNRSWAYENKDIVNNPGATGNLYGYDKENTASSYLALKLGAALKGSLAMDIGLGAAMNNVWSNFKNINNVANGVVLNDNTSDLSVLGLNLSGRMALGKDITAVLGIAFNMGSDKGTNLTYDAAGTKTGDQTVTTTNNYLRVGALLGKDIKATDSLKVKIASGVTFNTDQDAKTVTKDNMPGGLTTYQVGVRSSEIDISIPLNVAVEGKLNDTWSINAGANATILSTRLNTNKNNVAAGTDDPQAYYNRTWLDIHPSLGYAVGVTGKIGDLTLDLNVNPSIILNGPYLISGSTTGNLDMDLALGYAWK